MDPDGHFTKRLKLNNSFPVSAKCLVRRNTACSTPAGGQTSLVPHIRHTLSSAPTVLRTNSSICTSESCLHEYYKEECKDLSDVAPLHYDEEEDVDKRTRALADASSEHLEKRRNLRIGTQQTGGECEEEELETAEDPGRPLDNVSEGSLSLKVPPEIVGRSMCYQDSSFEDECRKDENSESGACLDVRTYPRRVLRRLQQLQASLMRDWERHERCIAAFQHEMCRVFKSRDVVMHRLHAVALETEQLTSALQWFSSTSRHQTVSYTRHPELLSPHVNHLQPPVEDFWHLDRSQHLTQTNNHSPTQNCYYGHSPSPRMTWGASLSRNQTPEAPSSFSLNSDSSVSLRNTAWNAQAGPEHNEHDADDNRDKSERQIWPLSGAEDSPCRLLEAMRTTSTTDVCKRRYNDNMITYESSYRVDSNDDQCIEESISLSSDPVKQLESDEEEEEEEALDCAANKTHSKPAASIARKLTSPVRTSQRAMGICVHQI